MPCSPTRAVEARRGNLPQLIERLRSQYSPRRLTDRLMHNARRLKTARPRRTGIAAPRLKSVDGLAVDAEIIRRLATTDGPSFHTGSDGPSAFSGAHRRYECVGCSWSCTCAS